MLTIYGPREDTKYWTECEALIAGLPSNVRVEYAGEVEHSDVTNALSQHDLFFFPTRGENYGHVIQEALVAGLPVLISDQTPWRELEQRGVGWALPLADPAAFARIIDAVTTWDDKRWQEVRENAMAYAREKMHDKNALNANLAVFRSAVGHSLGE